MLNHAEKLRRALLPAALAATTAITLTACTTDTAAPDGPGPTPVTFALDWAPNTNHIGVYVAEELGYFTDAGLEVEILPYAATSVVDLLDAGTVDFGIVGQSGVQVARAAGRDVLSVLQVTQKETGQMIFDGDRPDINRPADLDGLVFGGFGSPLLQALTRTVIENDGGAGDFTEVSLDTGAYEALASGRIDFTLSVSTWQDIQAEIDGRPYGSFRYQDYGVPELHTSGISADPGFAAEHPDTTRAFVRATQLGYTYAADNPAEAAQILIDANPTELAHSAELVTRSATLLATGGYLRAEGVAVGEAQPEIWAGYGAWLFVNDLLTDSTGAPVTDEPDWAEYYTNEFLTER